MIRTTFLCLLALALIGVDFDKRSAQPVEQAGIVVRFSPDGGCAAAIIEIVGAARKTLDIAAYHITHAEIAQAIIQANRRGISVRVVMDHSQSQQKYSSATTLHNAGVPVLIWKRGMMHNKFIIVDGKVVITGSFNFTKGADGENAENLLIIKDRPRIAAAYRQNFDRLVRDADRYIGVSAAR